MRTVKKPTRAEVERVAKALFAAAHRWPWDMVFSVDRKTYRTHARAAIAAMRKEKCQ